MDQIIEELISVCSREIDAFNRLLSTLHQKQRAIVEGEIDRLKRSMEEEEHLIQETQTLEKERVQRTRDLAEALSLKRLNPRLSEIIDKVETTYAQRLQEQRNLLLSIVERIQNLNQSNQFLLNYSLQFIDNSMRMLFHGQESPVYKKDGKMQAQNQEARLVDHRI